MWPAGFHKLWSLSPGTTTTVCPRACAPKPEKPLQRKARAPPLASTPIRCNWRKPAYSNKSPAQPKLNEIKISILPYVKQIASPVSMHETGCSGPVHWENPEGWHGKGGGGGGSEWGTHVHPWLIHVSVWQKPLQYCKVIQFSSVQSFSRVRLFATP